MNIRGVAGTAYPGRSDRVLCLARAVSRALMRPFFRLETEGIENLPRERAFILLPKHQRWEDIPLLSFASPRPLYYVAKAELFQNPLMGWFLRSLGGIPLNRRRPLESRRHLQGMIQILRRGEGVVVFPEGTYYRERMGPGRSGILRMILSRLPLLMIPVGIQYGRGRVRTRVCVRFGNPAAANGPLPADQLLERVMGEIAQLSGLAASPSGAH